MKTKRWLFVLGLALALATACSGDQAGGGSTLNGAWWSTFDMTTANPAAVGFQGAVFDGRYVYFVPFVGADGQDDGLVARYDTQADLTATSSWSTFDIRTINKAAAGFRGAAFDGRYVYFVPSGFVTTHGIVVRYDTQAAFATASSWSTFDTTTVNAGAKGFAGAVFDGRSLYLVPSDWSTSGLVARYDTQAAFATASSWSTFDATTVDARAKGFFGGAFDGRYLYFVPWDNGGGGHVVRYDTQAAFTTASSWSTFDTTMVNAAAAGFRGAAFDGRYVYLVPADDASGNAEGVVARYDTQAEFTTASSWATFDTTTVSSRAKGFWGAAFDGRYLYFVPFNGPSSNGGYYSGLVARYDTQADFATAGSWATFDTTTVSAGAKGFAGAAFDGRYVYLVPSYDGISDGIVARYDTQITTVPLGYAHGSFF